MQVRKLRVFRLKHHISLTELGGHCGLSPQRLSELELYTGGVTDGVMLKIRNGIEALLHTRGEMLRSLEQDYARHGDSLFDLVEEIDYEL